MTTIDDQAAQREELDREQALKLRKPELPHIGECHECGETTEGVFCCASCRDTYEQRERFMR